MNIRIRPIAAADDARLAQIIRATLAEFGANHPGTVYYDASTDHLSEVFKADGSWYWVAELDGEVVGGGGVYPTEGLPADTCELVKMYLETMPELKQALSVYAKFGFEYLPGPMGNSGHTGCSLWMLKKEVQSAVNSL